VSELLQQRMCNERKTQQCHLSLLQQRTR
jgi:hypothetical protein